MKKLIKLSILALAAMPVIATAQYSLYIPTQDAHYDIDGVTGGGPFEGELLKNGVVQNTLTMYCDSIAQEFYLGETFNVQIDTLNTQGGTPSLDPWVITHASTVANYFDAKHGVTLNTEEIDSAIQGVIWNLDGSLSGHMYSNEDANTFQEATQQQVTIRLVRPGSITSSPAFFRGPVCNLEPKPEWLANVQ
jgi:hypothetical protein